MLNPGNKEACSRECSGSGSSSSWGSGSGSDFGSSSGTITTIKAHSSETGPTTLEYDRYMLVQLLLLSLAFCVGQITVFVNVSAAVKTAKAIGGAKVSTLPLGVLLMASAMSSELAARAQAAWGRRRTFVMAAAMGAIGAGLSLTGVVRGSMVLYTLGFVPQGATAAFVNQFRFAAVDMASLSFRPYALAMVIGGAVGAALVAPEAATSGRHLLSTEYAGIYVILLCVFVILAVIVAVIDYTPFAARRPGCEAAAAAETATEPSASGENDSAHTAAVRSRWAIFSQRQLVAPLVGQAAAYSVMAVLMVGAPLPMDDAGHSFGDVARVVQAHILGMFLPSWFVTGFLIRSFGLHTVALGGMAVLAAGAGLLLLGSSMAIFVTALAVIGVGWNFAFIASTQLVTLAYTPAERYVVLGINDFVVFFLTGLALLVGPPTS